MLVTLTERWPGGVGVGTAMLPQSLLHPIAFERCEYDTDRFLN